MYPLSFTYILDLGFKFVYRGGRWSFAVASLCNNLQSMFNQHIRPHYTWDISRLPNFSPLTEHTEQCSGLNGRGQYLLKLVSSLPMCAEAVGGPLHVYLASILVQPLRACSSEGRIRNLCVKFSSHHMKKKGYNCAKWPYQTNGETAFCSFPWPMADWVSISNSVILFHITHVMVIILHNFQHYCIALFIA